MKASSKFSRQAGFHIVELVILVAVLAGVGAVGYKVWQRNHTVASTASTTVPAVPTVKKASDLDTAGKAVDQLDTSVDTTALSSIDNDLNSLQ